MIKVEYKDKDKIVEIFTLSFYEQALIQYITGLQSILMRKYEMQMQQSQHYFQ